MTLIAHLKSGWTDVLPIVFWLEGLGSPLAFLAFAGFSFVFERLSNHFLVGGLLEMVGKGPAQPPNHFKISSDCWESPSRLLGVP